MDGSRGTPFAVAASRPVGNNTSTSPIAFPMAETPTPDVRPNESVGHLSVHVEGAHPVEIPFLFEQQQKRMGPAVIVSLAYHGLMIGLTIFFIRYGTRTTASAALLPEQPNTNIIWLSQPGPGGGGGGGGNRMKEPPREAEMPGKDKITVPVEKPPKMEMQEAKKEPDPVAQLNIPAKVQAAALDSLPGALTAPPGPPTLSQGSGSGGGAGTGTGGGIGPGSGSGLGPGSGGNTGGGVFQPGNGVTSPIPLNQPKPAYTPEAMRARLQGTARIRCIVQPNGVCTNIEIEHSLDKTFGLDQEAMNSVKLLRFKPGMRMGQAVPVQVTIDV